jgi:serine/threonine protein phosphatase PrpC
MHAFSGSKVPLIPEEEYGAHKETEATREDGQYVFDSDIANVHMIFDGVGGDDESQYADGATA